MHDERSARANVDRRSFLSSAACGAGALALGRASGAQSPAAAAGPAAGGDSARATIRLAHLTDIHVQPERGAEAGMAAALAHAQSWKPDLLITGGDSVMDVFEAKRGRADELRTLFRQTLARECSVPLQHVTGNHDIFGWQRARSGTSGTEADWGKKFACDLFGVPRTFHSFDRGAWRFVCLDSVQPKGDGYTAYLDDEQFDWLSKLLAATPKSTHVCVVSHIPIMSITALTYGAPRPRAENGTDTVITHAEMHTDATVLHDLFKAAGNVKLCLSGHTHLLDRCDVDGVSYVCDGAVSGAWWKGAVEGVNPGYGRIELRPDGTFTHAYATYGWTARD
ncbi:MAG: metallophosphoesterase family protein [Phycisphaerales bacterium]